MDSEVRWNLGTSADGTLTVVDDPTIPGLRGSYRYDEEGVLATRVPLILNGCPCQLLNSRATAVQSKDALNGHCRSAGFRFTPNVRCGNTLILSGADRLDDLVSGIEDGFYVFGLAGGECTRHKVEIQAEGGWRIRCGKMSAPVRRLRLDMSLTDVLRNVDGVSDEEPAWAYGAWCCKGAQLLLPVDFAGPHVRIRDVSISDY